MLEKICKAELSDLQDIAALESEIFSDAWSLKSLEETWNQKNAVIFAAKTEEKIAGYLIIYYVDRKDRNSSFYAQTRGCRTNVPGTCGVL